MAVGSDYYYEKTKQRSGPGNLYGDDIADGKARMP